MPFICLESVYRLKHKYKSALFCEGMNSLAIEASIARSFNSSPVAYELHLIFEAVLTGEQLLKVYPNINNSRNF